MRVEEAKRILADLPDHYEIDLVDVERSGTVEFHIVTESETGSEDFSKEIDRLYDIAYDLMDEARDAADRLDDILDRFDENKTPTLYKEGLVRLKQMLDSLSDDACDLRDRLFEFLP